MTGGGTATLAFTPEDSFASVGAEPTYYAPGNNPTVTDVTLSHALARMVIPDEAESVESIAQNLEGAFAVEAVVSADTFDQVHNCIFNDSGTAFTPGAAATSRWFVGIDYLDGVAQRELIGVTPTDFTIQWQQGGMVRWSGTFVYQTEEKDTSITPSSITQASEASSVPFHGGDLDVDAVDQTVLRSFTLSISNIARLQFGEERTALNAVIASPETTLDASSVMTEADQLDLAYGGSSETSPADLIGSVSATIDLAADGTTVATYNLSNVTPNDYSWDDLVNHDSDMTESVSYHVNGVAVA